MLQKLIKGVIRVAHTKYRLIRVIPNDLRNETTDERLAGAVESHGRRKCEYTFDELYQHLKQFVLTYPGGPCISATLEVNAIPSALDWDSSNVVDCITD